MTLKGRIVGVRLSESCKVEYLFQPEGVVDIQVEAESARDFLILRDKNGRYPMLRFDSPFVIAPAESPSDAFSVGYLLMERKELVKIHLKGDLVKEISVFHGSVDSIHVGVGFDKEGK